MHAAALTAQVVLTGSLTGLAACVPTEGPEAAPVYLGAQAGRLDGDLIQVRVAARGGAGARTADDYARCAAAAYAVEKDQRFLRHLRTLTDKEGGVWRADAVYSVSPDEPEGLRTIDAEETAADCAERGVPVAVEGLEADG